MTTPKEALPVGETLPCPDCGEAMPIRKFIQERRASHTCSCGKEFVFDYGPLDAFIAGGEN